MQHFVSGRYVVVLGLLSAAMMLLLVGCGDSGKPADAEESACGACACGGEKVDPATVTEPDGWTANTGEMNDSALLARGLELWSDKSLSKAGGTSCQTCHSNATNQFKESFAKPYPHDVGMAEQKSGKGTVTATEMVQFCMVVPMKAEPFKWDDTKLAALTRAVEEKQKEYREATK